MSPPHLYLDGGQGLLLVGQLGPRLLQQLHHAQGRLLERFQLGVGGLDVRLKLFYFITLRHSQPGQRSEASA